LPTLVASSTTPAQYIAAAGGASNAAQATFNFVSTSGAATIQELKFTVSGSDVPAGASNTVTQICVGSVCAPPVTNATTGFKEASLTGLNLAVPNGGGGLTQNVLMSYSSVGTSGITPGTHAIVGLSYVKYQAGGATITSCPTNSQATACSNTTLAAVIYAPGATSNITLVGSKPAVVVGAGGGTGMILNASTKVGQVTITADPKGAIKLRQLHFNIGYSGFTSNSGAGPDSVDTATLTFGGQTTGITGVTCTVVDINNVVCKTTTNGGTFAYADDLAISAGQSQQFDLYITTTGEANTGTNKASVSTSLYNVAGGGTTSTAGTTSAFLWDDTSNNGGTGSTGLTGTSIYGFPGNSYTVTQ